MSRTVECNDCGREVLLNGIGSSRNTMQRILTATLQFVLPFTAKKFLGPSEKHDLAVHKGCPVGEYFELWYRRVDRTFRDDCMAEAKKSRWRFSREYYSNQADGLYDALLFNSGSGYPKKPCNH